MVLLLVASHTQALLACLANLPSDWSRYRHDPVPRHVQQSLTTQGHVLHLFACASSFQFWAQILSHNIPNSRDPRACLRCSPIKALIPL